MVSCLLGDSLPPYPTAAGSLGHPRLMSLYIATNRLRTELENGGATSKNLRIGFLEIGIPSSSSSFSQRNWLWYIKWGGGGGRQLDYSFWSSFNDLQHSVVVVVEIPSQLLFQFRSYTNRHIYVYTPFHQTDTGVCCVYMFLLILRLINSQVAVG